MLESTSPPKNSPEPLFVSVIVPVYNGERTIGSCLQAILAQDYPRERFEILAVDNNSSDETIRVVSGFDRVKLFLQTIQQSSYATRNLGVTHAAGEIIAFTDSDCIPASNWLTELTAPFCDRSVSAVGGRVLDAEAGNLVEVFLREIGPLKGYQDAPGQFLKPLLTANAAFRKTVFDELGRFNANLYTGADIDLAWRLQMKYGDCVRYARDAVVYHRHRSNLKSMFRQYRRHGFGEIFLDAMYRQIPGYPRTLRYQVSQILRQCLELLKNLRSFLYRLLKHPSRRDRYYLLEPLFWFVAQSGNTWGKLQALWATRGLRSNPALRQWQDPGG